jgi:hypothetical protein
VTMDVAKAVREAKAASSNTAPTWRKRPHPDRQAQLRRAPASRELRSCSTRSCAPSPVARASIKKVTLASTMGRGSTSTRRGHARSSKSGPRLTPKVLERAR